ncbi:glycerate kinase family protein [Dysosmobacter sp.]
MKTCIFISDSFKGTLSSQELCQIAQECFAKHLPDCTLVKIPVADGGEGTVACFQQACGGTLVPVSVQGPYGEPIRAAYLRLPGQRAVIEMASAAGLPQVEGRKNPCLTSTYGVGQLIRHAVEHGSREILLGLGGSCTNDGGCGCAAALGVKFKRADGSSLIPTGETLGQIRSIDLEDAAQLLRDVHLTAMCDIDNPLYGPNGAAYVFGPQKGATEQMVLFLDQQLRSLSAVIEQQLGRSVSALPGAGAAGGFGAGMVAFFNAELRPGIEVVLDLVEFDRLLSGCDAVFTGEGRLDQQSIHGKVISGVARRARRHHVPVIAIVGSVSPDAEGIPDDSSIGIHAVFSINRQAVDFSVSRAGSRENYAYTLNNLLQFLKAIH